MDKAEAAWIGRHPEGALVLSWEPQRLQDYEWERLWAESALKKAGWRRCAEGQRATQWCPMAEALQAEIHRLNNQLQATCEPIAWMVVNTDGQDAFVTTDPTLAEKGQRALPLYTAPMLGR